MPDPLRLLAVARQLAAGASPSPPTDEHLRRAISTAYYAVFHKVASSGAGRFVGKQRTAGAYSLLYRSFQHGRMKAVCESLNVRELNARLQRQVGRRAVTADARTFAEWFCRLQDERHQADYDPIASTSLADALDIVTLAGDAIAIFDTLKSDEQADILALMLAPGRS